MGKIWKIILVIFLGVGLSLIWFGESRKFYSLDSGRYITVWKTFNNTCYIVPRKYYGALRPSDNYIQTTNIDNVDVVWSSKKTIVVNGGPRLKIVNNNRIELEIYDYNSNRIYYDKLYLDFDGNYHRYKKSIDYISLFIKESYAKNKEGKKL